MVIGNIAFVLHAHLPFVRHPEHKHFLEELWFYEAMGETYIPLLRVLSRLEDDGIAYKLLLSLSPPLVAMMEDPLLQQRFAEHVQRIIRLALREAERYEGHDPRRGLARYYADYYTDILWWFEERCGRRIAPAFGQIARLGNLDIMTCGATHGFFPILQQCPAAVRAQLRAARDYHTEVFGRAPEGIWTPECAYVPGLEAELNAAGFSYTFVDSHGLENAATAPQHGVYAPLVSPEGVAFFARDKETSHQVWSADHGYPGNGWYREFYRDQGWELSESDLSEFIIDGHIRINTGLKYCRITDRHGQHKELYDPDAAREQTARDADHFIGNRIRQVQQLASVQRGRPPLIVAPYDAELYGHWWFEGPQFLDYVLRKMHYDQDVIQTMTPAEYLRQWPDNQQGVPAGSSWGGDGTYEFWVNDSNMDIIPALHQAADRMATVAQRQVQRPMREGIEEETARQMVRELMLAQASDWPFIMRTGTSPEYARKRVRDHLNRFWALDAMLAAGKTDQRLLKAIRQTDNIFPHCRVEWFL